MDTAPEIGRNPMNKHQIQYECEDRAARLTRDGTAEPFSRDQILRRERGPGNLHFPCSADHEQDWQPYTVDPYYVLSNDHTYKYINTYVLKYLKSESFEPPSSIFFSHSYY